MIYNDGAKMDSNLRVLECPRCHNTQIGRDDEFCIICGLNLHNRCVGQAIYDNYGNYCGDGDQHDNPGNARFCATCGAETTFFREKILCPYNEYKQNSDNVEIDVFTTTNEVIDDDDNLPF